MDQTHCFFNNMFAELSNFHNASILMGGDFNTVLNLQLDCILLSLNIRKTMD